MDKACKWKTIRNITSKKLKTGTLVKDHPLKNLMLKLAEKSDLTWDISGNTSDDALERSFTSTVLDPLSEFALEMDPLSKAAMEVSDSLHDLQSSTHIDQENLYNEMEPWSTRKIGILSKFTTSEKLCIISFLPDGEKVLVRAQSGSIDKVQHRLDQLDTFEENTQKKLNVSQAEYVGQIEQLNKELLLAWNTEQRVKSLKIAIQCAKLLADVDVLQFYPSKFVLVTDILDTFGRIVYDRLKAKAETAKEILKTPLPDKFSPDMVPETAKETCLNWFYKIASIRELVPRIYVELSLIKSYNFISVHDCRDGLIRISDMIMGIGNPLVAVYMRCYLCIAGINALNKKSDQKFLQTCFKGFIDSYEHVFGRSILSEIRLQKMDMPSYLTLYIPALNFMTEAAAYSTNESFWSNLISFCKRHKNSSLILNTIISVFKPNKISEKILDIVDLIEKCADYQAIPLSMLLKALGNSVNAWSPPAENTTLILATISRNINSLSDTTEFITCLDAWVIYFVKHLTNQEVNKLLGDIIERLIPNRKFENFYNELKIIINKIVSNTPDFESLLLLDNFLQIIDLFHEESVKVEVCKNILVLSNNEQKTNDPVVINTLMYLCSVIHDSVNALIPEDEYRQIGEIICTILRRVDYGKDLEQQLNFYVMARSAFCNIDTVLAELVQQVNKLSVNARQTVKGLHTKKTGDFVRACAAYCFITIPSVLSEKTKLQLYLLSAQVALFNQCFGQAEENFKAAWTILPNFTNQFSQKDSFIISYLRQTVSALLVLPDNPEKGVLNVLRLLLNTLKSLELKDDHILALLYINVINMLAIMVREEFSYQVDKVESNDALYGADPKFIVEVDKICTVLLGEIKTLLYKYPGSINQYLIAIELLTTVLTRADLNEKEIQLLTVDLWNLIIRNTHSDKKLVATTRLYVQRSHSLRNTEGFKELIQQLKVS